MKKITCLVAVAALMLSLSFSANAFDNGSGFHLGIKGGLNFTKMKMIGSISDIQAIDLKTYTGFNAGVALKFGLPLGFGLQPEILYQQSGTIADVDILNLKSTYKQGDIIVPINIQWGWPFLNGNLRPYAFVSPFVGCSVMNLSDGKKIEDAIKKFQYGVGVGVGVELWRVQVSFKYNWNLNELADADKDITTRVNGKFNGAEISVAFFIF